MLDHGVLETGSVDESRAHLHSMRHSAAHVMADAVLKLFPEAKMGIGPPTQDGFYYDFEVARPFTPDDLAEIETLMKESIAGSFPFEREELDFAAAKSMFADQPYKLELIDGLTEAASLSIYRHNGFVDLCQGPHVENTGQIPALKLLSVAGAYWRGDEKRPMLQRIYGAAFESEEDLEAHLARLEEAERRDHRTLGRQLGLYTIQEEIGPGLVVWHPKGGRVRSIIEDYWKAIHYRNGYDIVYSPHIGRSTLWQTSGHLDFYRDGMYAAVVVDEQEYFLKPMNCPFHIGIYRSTLRSYRELPLRFAELGTVYRYERSGVLHGLMRVRGFTQDDAHIFCRPEQVEDEIGGVLELTFELLRAFGFSDYSIALSTRPEKYVGDVAMWDHATNSLRGALEQRGLAFTVDEGGGAFYGPKIDINITDALGRAWQCTTVQFDFNLPERFDLTYQDESGRTQPSLHGTPGHPRFHGTFPGRTHRALRRGLPGLVGPSAGRGHSHRRPAPWSTPNRFRKTLYSNGFRIETDTRNERMNQKIRTAQLQKVPYMLVVGDREMEAGAVAVRRRDGENLGAMPVGEFCGDVGAG